jgi:hypothetical protein
MEISDIQVFNVIEWALSISVFRIRTSFMVVEIIAKKESAISFLIYSKISPLLYSEGIATM